MARKQPSSPPPAKAIPPGGHVDRWKGSLPAVGLAVLMLVYSFPFFVFDEGVRRAVVQAIVLPDYYFSVWLGRNPSMQWIWDRGPLLLSSATIWGMAYAAGSLVLRRFGFASGCTTRPGGGHNDLKRGGGANAERERGGLSWLEHYVVSQGVGLILMSHFALVLGLLGLLKQAWLFWLSGIAVIATCAWFASQDHRHRRSANAAAARGRGNASAAGDLREWLSNWVLVLGVPFLLAVVLGGVLPPVLSSDGFDVREYHLQVPKEWVEQGAITFLPHNIYGNMPLGPEMLAVWGMELLPTEPHWRHGALAGKAAMAMWAPLGALALWAIGRRYWSNTAGVGAALLYLSLPGVVSGAIVGYNEPVQGGCLALSLLLLLRATEPAARREGVATWSLLLLAGFLAGGAAAAKYTAVVLIVGPLAVLAAASAFWSAGWLGQANAETPRAPGKIASLGEGLGWWRRLLLFLAGAAIAAGPWYAKNWLLTGNPVYPLAYRVFGGASRTDAKDAQWRNAHRIPGSDNGTAYSPGRLADDLIEMLVTSQQLHWGLWPLAMVGVIFQRRRRMLLVAVVSLLVCYVGLWWCATHRLPRFWVPVLPIAALLAGLGLTAVDSWWWRRVATGVLIASMIFGFLHAGVGVSFVFPNEPFSDESNPDVVRINRPPVVVPYPYFVHWDDLQSMPTWIDPNHAYLNEHLPSEAKVLLVGDATPLEIERPVYYHTCFDDCLLEEYAGRTSDAREQRAALAERGITHVMIRWSEVKRYQSPGNYGYSSWVTPERIAGLVRSGVLRPLLLDFDPKSEFHPTADMELLEVVGRSDQEGNNR